VHGSGTAPMLKTITKFVLQRRRRVQQVPQQVIEEDDTRDPASASEDLTQPTEPQVDEPSSQPVLATVKWYSPDKRYGFVTLSDGSGDAFLHATALAGMGIRTLQPGETLALRSIAAPRLRRGCRERGADRHQTDSPWRRASKRWAR